MEMLDKDKLAPMGAEGCAKGGADAFAEGSGQEEVSEGAEVPKKRGRPRIHPVKEEDICGAAFRKQGRKPKNGWKAEELLEGEAINGAWEKVAKLLLQGEPGMPIREMCIRDSSKRCDGCGMRPL